MPKILYFSDSIERGRGATISLESGEPCMLSIAQSGVFVRNSRFGIFGPTLFSEKDPRSIARCSLALAYTFQERRFPDGVSTPVLRSFFNAIMHCSSTAEVVAALGQAVATAEAKLGKPIEELSRDDLPAWAVEGSPWEHAVQSRPQKPTEVVRGHIAESGGATLDTAIVIQAANSLEGVPQQYSALNSMFGKNWKLVRRNLMTTEDGRKIDRFIVLVSETRREVHFDVTSWMKGNAAEDTKRALTSMMADRDRQLTIALPKEELFTLAGGLAGLSAEQLAQLGLTNEERGSMVGPLSTMMTQWTNYEAIPDHVDVTMLRSNWTIIRTVLTFWEPVHLLQEEEIENLKAIITGRLKGA